MSDISIIVPVYNSEAYIKRCVDSILAQTFENFDLILIDDGSPDNCPQICDEYAEADHRVYVIHQKNAGPSKARNSGIDWAFENSKSQYITFVDSDDCIHPQFLERMYSAICENCAEVSMCRHEYITCDISVVDMPNHDKCKTYKISAEDLLVNEPSSFNYAWGKVYSKNCFEDIRYPENLSFGEDSCIVYKALFECKGISFVEDCLYYYFFNENGITKSRWTSRSMEAFEGIREQLAFYRENGYERAYNKQIELYIQQCAYQIHRIRDDRKDYKNNKLYYLKLKKKMKELLHNSKNLSVFDSIYWCEALHPQVAKIWKLIKKINSNLKRYGLIMTAKKALNKIVGEFGK